MVAAEFSSMVMASFIVDANNRVALFHALVFRFAVLICSSAMLSAATRSGQISMVSSSGSGAGAASSDCTFLLSDDPEAFSAGSSAGSFLTLGGGTAGCFGVNAGGVVGGVGGSYHDRCMSRTPSHHRAIAQSRLTRFCLRSEGGP